MDAMTGVISGVPSEVSEGNYTLIVTNAAGSDSVIFDMMIEPMSMDTRNEKSVTRYTK